MEDALTRREYPAMLVSNPSTPHTVPSIEPEVKERLSPAAAVAKFKERVNNIGKINTEIADWLLVRLHGYMHTGPAIYTFAGATESRGSLCSST